LFSGLALTPGILIAFFKNGPFAYDGIVAVYIPLGIFFVWIVIMTWLLLGAVGAEERLLAATPRVATADPVQAWEAGPDAGTPESQANQANAIGRTQSANQPLYRLLPGAIRSGALTHWAEPSIKATTSLRTLANPFEQGRRPVQVLSHRLQRRSDTDPGAECGAHCTSVTSGAETRGRSHGSWMLQRCDRRGSSSSTNPVSDRWEAG
jgi:hypothetical protein